MEIEEQIIDIDGSCRDINFPKVDRFNAIALINWIDSFSTLEKATDSQGHELSVEDIKKHFSLSSHDGETIISYWRSDGLISRLQLFFIWQKRSEIFIELTFFPEDIDKKIFNIKEFLKWLKPILLALNTNEYYVRYQNISWKYGDTSESSGVIFSNWQGRVND